MHAVGNNEDAINMFYTCQSEFKLVVERISLFSNKWNSVLVTSNDDEKLNKVQEFKIKNECELDVTLKKMLNAIKNIRKEG